MELLVGIVVAVVAVMAGLFLIVKRKAFSRFMKESQQSVFGKADERLVGQPEPGYMVAVGLGTILIGGVIAFVLVTR